MTLRDLEPEPGLALGAVEIVAVERKQSRKLGPMDAVTFLFQLRDAASGTLVAEARPTWLFLRA